MTPSCCLYVRGSQPATRFGQQHFAEGGQLCEDLRLTAASAARISYRAGRRYGSDIPVALHSDIESHRFEGGKRGAVCWITSGSNYQRRGYLCGNLAAPRMFDYEHCQRRRRACPTYTDHPHRNSRCSCDVGGLGRSYSPHALIVPMSNMIRRHTTILPRVDSTITGACDDDKEYAASYALWRLAIAGT